MTATHLGARFPVLSFITHTGVMESVADSQLALHWYEFCQFSTGLMT